MGWGWVCVLFYGLGVGAGCVLCDGCRVCVCVCCITSRLMSEALSLNVVELELAKAGTNVSLVANWMLGVVRGAPVSTTGKH